MLHPLREDDPNGPVWTPQAERAPAPMDHSIGGRKPCQYSEQTARIILARVEGGQAVGQVAADPDMPSYRTIYDWLERHPGFAAAWAQMRSDIASFKRRRIAEREQGAQVWEAIRARDEGRRPRRKAGRKSTYTPERGEAFCDLIMEGLSTREASARPGMPAEQMVHRWLRNHPDFRSLYLMAVEARDERLADEVLMLSERAGPANLHLIQPRVKRLQQRVAAVRPALWRWD
jgi:hypothetical protein